MSFDNSRYLFNPFNDYSGLVMPQGRVQLDADWNEFLAEIARRIQAGTLDIMGRAVYPATTPDAFYISSSGTPWVVNIGQGRIYVDGLMAENHGPIDTALWDPALAELSGAPQPAPSSISGTPSIPFTSQPYFPAAATQTNPQISQDLPNAAGSYLFYLDIWIREVTWLEDPFTANPAQGPGIIDPAVGIDTSGRLQTVWQVRWMPNSMAAGTGPAVTCGTPDTSISWPPSSNGLLTNGIIPNTQTGDCCLTTGTGYTGLENQFYRVQVHQGGPAGTATFKWSRENASVGTSVSSITQGANPGGQQATILTVASLGRDQVLNFSNGDWIELLDDNMELNGQPDPNYPSPGVNIYGTPGIFCQIDTVDPTTNSIYLVTPTLANPPIASPGLHTRIIRWETSPTLPNGQTTIPTGNTALQLENGLTVTFSSTSGSPGNFLSGDFWTFSARTDGSYDQLTSAPPRGTHHHYTKLSVVVFDGSGNATQTPDCRKPWACSDEGDCGCCTATVGDNQTTFGKFTSITQAIASLPANGGTVCILPGQYYELVVLDGLTQVTLQGSGPQTTLYAPPAPGGTSDESGNTTPPSTATGINAIITIANCQHIELTGFTVEAPTGMACVLLDQIATDPTSSQLPQYNPNQANWFGSTTGFTLPTFSPSDTDVKLTNLVLSASNFPAIVAAEATAVNIVGNRILMQDTAGLYPALYASGAEITIERNWIGLQDNFDSNSYATDQLLSDNPSNFTQSTNPPVGNGGIQIGGYSTCVTILNNDIVGGAFNAITLGAILRGTQGNFISGLNGLFFTGPTSGSATLVLPATDPNGNPLAADGPIQNIRIERNRILNTGLCAIGPVGFFNSATSEVVSLANLSILGNTISGALQASISPISAADTGFGYGAICLADIRNLILHDNIITDFGFVPGLQVCGLYFLAAEQVDISRNRIEETRDWAIVSATPPDTGSLQAGIAIVMVSAPVINNNPGLSPYFAQPGLPALRMDQNIVRVPLGLALEVFGRGPFSITGNHFASGGTIPSPAPNANSPSLTVYITNLGRAIELDTPTTFTSLWGTVSDPITPTLQVLDNALSRSSSGMVLFTNNVCQLETRASGVEGLASVYILSLDHLNFSNNHTWMDGVGTAPLPNSSVTITALMDVFLFAESINVSGNRFQEVPNSVLFSGITAGITNTTTNNISTFCLFSEPNSAPFGANANNISLEAAVTTYRGSNLCNYISSSLLNGFGLPAKTKVVTPPEGAFQYPYTIHDTNITSDPIEKMKNAVDQVDTTSANRVQQLSNIHQARLAQVTRIAATVTKRSGPNSALAKSAQAAVTTTEANLTQISLIKQQVSVQPPAVTATGWALYGVVNNSSNSPVSAYSLYFVDSTNTFQNAFGTAYTGSDGSFQLVYPGPDKGEKAPTTELYLQVVNASGDPIYTTPNSFAVTPGVATYQLVTLPAGEKPIGILPIVFRGITIPKLDNEISEKTTPPETKPESGESNS